MTKALLLFCAALLASAPSASAIPLSAPAASNQSLVRIGLTDCKGPITSEAKPIFGEKRLAKMRKEGKLLDTFACGRCTYNLAGDPGVAYYVKTCSK
jgi:hypothetical protein